MLPRGMARRFPGSQALCAALLGVALLLLLVPARARAEEWEVALAKRVVRMGTLSVGAMPGRPLVRIGVAFDPRATRGEREAKEQVEALRNAAGGLPGPAEVQAEILPVNDAAALAEAFATRGFRIVLLFGAIQDPEWSGILALAARHHVGTVSAIPDFLREPEQVKRRGPSTFVFRREGGKTGLFADRERVAIEGVFGAAVLGNAPLVKSEPIPTPPPPPASGVAP